MHMIDIRISNAPKLANNAARDLNRSRLCASGVTGTSRFFFFVIAQHPVVYSALPLRGSLFGEHDPKCWNSEVFEYVILSSQSARRDAQNAVHLWSSYLQLSLRVNLYDRRPVAIESRGHRAAR